MANRDLQEFEKLFRELFRPLFLFALKYVKDPDDAKGLVHDVFVTVWERFLQIPAESNLRSYLYTAVKNRCLNHLRDQKKNVSLHGGHDDILFESNTAMEAEELEREIEIGIAALPEKCRIIFELNRKEGLKYAQVAEKLGISAKTVEAQMTRAMSLLRVHLGEFLSIVILFNI